ncbi:ZP domain-containing protein [Trichostrongylus colubriformis]|uniref:ZP domain-containing protein n=1 Tax=Trichostrongylus colubriformis TaxID=6319 RepID=A0AAN8ILF4_TRICO
MANIGEPVVHKWTCNSDTHGFLVHSCVVRDQNGNEYNLVDERGCVAERALVPDIIYASDLSYAYTTINAFRFAEQIVVHFACQITLCQKRDQGCEGIAPPTCHPINFPPIQAIYKHTTSIPTRFTARDPDHYGISIEDRNGLYDIVSTRLQTTTPLSHNMVYTTSSRPILPPSSSPNTIEEADISGSSAEFGIEISKLDEEPRQAKQMRGYRTETLSSISNLPVGNEVDPLPLPSPAGIFYAYNRRPRSSHENANNVTLDVESKRMLVFSSDDSERLDSGTLRRQSQVSSTVECNRLVLGQTVFVCVAAILQVSSVVVILVQRRLYRRNLHALLLRSESSRY